MILSFRGIRFNISPLFFILTSLLLIFDKSGYMSLSILSSIIHELAHIFTMIFIKLPPKEISVKYYGIEIKSQYGGKKQAITVALSGPFANIVIFAVSMVVNKIYPNELLMYFAIINLVIGAFNLLPISSLDGGDLLSLMLLTSLSIKKSTMITKIAGYTVVCILLLPSIFLAFKHNFNMLLISIYLFILNLINCN